LISSPIISVELEKLEHVFGDGEVVWRDGSKIPEPFSRNPDTDARLKTLLWPVAREPLELR
jgi:hypothetical protein